MIEVGYCKIPSWIIWAK